MNDLRLLGGYRRRCWNHLLIFLGVRILVIIRSTSTIRRGIGIAIATVIAAAIVAVLSQNLPPNLGPGRLVLDEAGIKSEHIQNLVLFQIFIVQTQLEHDLIIGLDQVQLGDDTGKVLKVPLAVLHEHLDLVLDSLPDGPIVQKTAESFHDGPNSCRAYLQQSLADHPHVRNGHLDGIVGRIAIEQNGQQLQTEQFVRHALVEELSQKVGRRHGLGLVTTFVCLLKLEDGTH